MAATAARALVFLIAASSCTPQAVPSASPSPTVTQKLPALDTASPSATATLPSPAATPAGTPANFELSIGPGVSDADVADVREGTAIVSRFLASTVGGDRTRSAVARIRVGNGTEEHCCFASPGAFDIITAQHFWTKPSAPSPETWTVNTERKELAAHEYVHVWQHELGSAGCVRGSSRWLVEGMAEWIAYHSLIEAGLIADGRIDVFIKRQLRSGRYLPLSDLVRAFPFDAEPYAVSYLAVDMLAASTGPLALRNWCERVGTGEEWTAAFEAVFGERVQDFYVRFETRRTEFAR